MLSVYIRGQYLRLGKINTLSTLFLISFCRCCINVFRPDGIQGGFYVALVCLCCLNVAYYCSASSSIKTYIVYLIPSIYRGALWYI